jgi:hypothetical protein
VFAAFAWDARNDFQNTSLQRPAAEANDRFRMDTALALTFAVTGVACAAAAYFIGRRP